MKTNNLPLVLLFTVLSTGALAQSLPTTSPTEATSAAPPVSVCGDGRVEATEACDDGNTLDGDGCSSACQAQPSQEGGRYFLLWKREEQRPLRYTPGEKKSRNTALGLSLGGLAGAGALFGASILTLNHSDATGGSDLPGVVMIYSSIGAALIAPSLGYAYLGDWRHTAGVSLRRLGSAVALFGGAILVFDATFLVSDPTPQENLEAFLGGALVTTGLVAWAGYTLGDYLFLSRAVKRSNERLASLRITPTMRPGASAGLALSWRF